jgi:hypothetical protein
MNYYLDTEFIEGQQSYAFRNTYKTSSHHRSDIDRNSVPRWREYYAVSKDFNLKEAWNRNQKEITELRITRMAKSFR